MRFVTLIVALLGWANVALANVPAPDTPNLPKTAGALLSVWTQFVAGSDLNASNTAIELRYVLLSDGKTTCDAVSVMEDGIDRKVVYSRGLMTEANPINAKVTDYTVLVCAALLASSTKAVSLENNGSIVSVYNGTGPAIVAKGLPGPARLGDRITGSIKGIALGDSGCRGDTQNCQTDWVLNDLAKSAANENPDFVIHVGDYHYFYETDFNFWGKEHGGNRFGYWLQEILVPAGPLLRSAPWIMGRGNHERCTGQWVGNAYHTLFGPRDYNGKDACLVATKPGLIPGVPATWAVDLQPKDQSAKPFRFFVIDNVNSGRMSNAGYDAAGSTPALVDGTKVGWISHYPPIKMAHYQRRWNYGEQTVKDNITNNLSTAVSGCSKGQPCIPSLVFAGHQHFFQEFDFDAPGVPLVAIVGHGGVGIGSNQQPGYSLNPPVQASTCRRNLSRHMPFAGAGHATVRTAQFHGYMVIERNKVTTDKTGWDRRYVFLPPNVAFKDIGTCPFN